MGSIKYNVCFFMSHLPKPDQGLQLVKEIFAEDWILN